MKPKSSNRFLLAAITLAGLSMAMPSAFAATYYWDNDGTTAGFGTAAGTWAAPTIGDDTQGWSSSNVGTAAPGASITTLGTSNTVDAVNFGVGTVGNGLGAGTITVSGTVNCGNMTFGSQSGSIVLSGGAINLTNAATGPTLTVNSTSAASTIESDLTGGLAASTVAKAGAGTLYLSGNNSYLSRLSINAGVLVLNSANALPGGIGTSGGTTGLTFNGGMLGLGNGDFTRSYNATQGTVGAFSTPSNTGAGWAAYGADRIVNVGGAGASTTFFNGKPINFGSATSTHMVEFKNGLQTTSVTRLLVSTRGITPGGVDGLLSGVITENAGVLAGLDKTGTGTMALTGANTFTGSVLIKNGTIIVNSLASTGNPSPIGAGLSGFTLLGGTFKYAPVTPVGGVATGGSGHFTNRNFGISASGSIDASGTGAVVFNAPAGNIISPDVTGIGFTATGANKVLTLAPGNTTNLAVGMTVTGPGIAANSTIASIVTTTGTLVTAVTLTSSGNVSATVGGETATFGYPSNRTLTLTGTNTDANTLGGNLQDSSATGAGVLSLAKTGIGNWTLAGANTYTGATLVSDGTLTLSGSGAVNASSGITINGSGAKLLQTSSVAATPVVTLTQGTVTGSGTINTVNVGDATGGIISNNNGVAGAALSIGALTFNGAATVNTFSNSTSAPIATTALATNAAGNVTINASSTGWTDNAIHELISYGGGSVGGAGSTQFVLGTVSGLSARQVALPLSDTGTAITLTITGDTPFWTGDGDGKWNTGSINNWKLVSDNSSALFLTNDNALFNDSATGAGPISVDIDAADVAPNSTVFNNGTKDYVLGSTGGFGISSGSLVKNGGGKLTINNANTYPGGTTVNAGTLALGNANAIGTGLLTLNGGNLDSSVTNLVNSGNNAQLWNSDFTFIGTESLNLGTGAVTLSGNRSVTVAANNLTVGGTIGGGAVDLIKLGTGTLTLAGGTSFSGSLVVSAGSLALTPGSAGSFTMSSALVGSGILSVNPFAANSSNLTLGGDLSGFTGTVNVATSGGFDSKLATTGTSSSFGAGTVVNVASGATWYNTANQTGITVNLFGTGNSEGLGALRLDAGILDSTSSVVLKTNSSIGGGGTATINAPISEDGGSFGFTKQGSGTLFLGGTNSYSGLTAVSSGVLVLQNASALGTTAGGTTVADGTRVELDNLTVTGEPITITGTGGDNLGALRSRSGNSVWTGPITVDAELTRIGAIAGATFEVSGVIDDGPNDYRIRFRPNNATATIIVSGANTYTGGTSVFGGNVIASSFNSVVGGSPSSSFGAPVTEANGLIIIGIAGSNNDPILSYVGAGETTDRTFQIGDNSATPAAGDNGAGAIENNGISGPLVFSAPVFNSPTNNTVNANAPTRVLTLGGTNTAANTIAGVIQNNQVAGNPTAPVAITKAGVGSWTLGGANTYTGATVVNGGTLKLAAGGSMSGTPTITLASGTGFDVSTPTTPLSLGAGQALRTGATGANDTATLTTAAGKDLTLSAGGLVFQTYGGANGSSATNAPLTVTGASAGELKLNGAPVTVTTTSLLAPGTYVLVANGGSASVTGTPGALTVTGSGVDGTPSLAVTGGQLVLIVPLDYSDWAADFPTLTDISSTLDFDGGGLTTGLEWVVGGDPTLASDDAGNTPTLDNSDPNFLEFVFKRRDAAVLDPNTKIVVEYGSDLSGWRNTTVHGVIDGVLTDDSVDLGGGFHQVTVSIPKSLAVGGKLFARLGVSGLPVTLLSENFETGNGGFTAVGSPNDWDWGTPNSDNNAGLTLTTGSGGSAKCWATNLGLGGTPSGVINPAANSILRSPDIDLTGITGAQLRFAAAYDAQTGDAIQVLIRDAGTDALLGTINPVTVPATSNWTNLGPFSLSAGNNTNIYLEFRYDGTDANYIGLYIDNVVVATP